MTTTEEQNKTIDETIKEIEESLKRPSTPTPEPREKKSLRTRSTICLHRQNN